MDLPSEHRAAFRHLWTEVLSLCQLAERISLWQALKHLAGGSLEAGFCDKRSLRMILAADEQVARLSQNLRLSSASTQNERRFRPDCGMHPPSPQPELGSTPASFRGPSHPGRPPGRSD
jgi:hypothetical protein